MTVAAPRFPLASCYLTYLDRGDPPALAAARARWQCDPYPDAVELWGALDRRDFGVPTACDLVLLLRGP